MKFTCEKNLFNESIMAAQKAAAVKSSFPALQGLLIKTMDQSLKITGFDLELGIESVIEANILEEGSIVLDAKVFADIIRRLPEETVTVTVDEKLITNIICGMAEYNIIGINAEEFPELPKVNAEKSILIPSNMLKSMIKQTLFAVSVSDNKPVHTGALFEIENNNLKIVAVDGFRLALRQEKLEGKDYENFSFIVPGKTLSEILKLLKDEDSLVNISLTRKHILFAVDKLILISRLLEGEFLNYKNVFPKDNRITAIVDTRKLTDAVERASLITNDKLKSPIRSNFDLDAIKISCRTSMGNVFDEIAAKIEGGSLEIGFNNRYMIDALRATELETVRIELNTHLTPIVIKPMDSEEFIFLVLPVRLKNDE